MTDIDVMINTVFENVTTKNCAIENCIVPFRPYDIDWLYRPYDLIQPQYPISDYFRHLSPSKWTIEKRNSEEIVLKIDLPGVREPKLSCDGCILTVTCNRFDKIIGAVETFLLETTYDTSTIKAEFDACVLTISVMSKKPTPRTIDIKHK